MATYKGLANEREKLADKSDRRLSRMILEAQKALMRAIIMELADRTLSITEANRVVDNVFRMWVLDYGLKIANYIAENILNIHNLNTRYYGAFLNASRVQAIAGGVLTGMLEKYGITPDGSVSPTGYIFNSISDQSIPRRLKSVITADIQSKVEPSKIKRNIRNILGRVGVGLVETKLAESFPSGLLQVDREVNGTMAVELELNHAIFQGGLIKTSRPFCIERNNKVFTREEILKFGTPQDKYGGYTNKSTGEFQGKTKTYNPITDIGGYNCRHFYSWISEELAEILRPDLKKPNQKDGRGRE